MSSLMSPSSAQAPRSRTRRMLARPAGYLALNRIPFLGAERVLIDHAAAAGVAPA